MLFFIYCIFNKLSFVKFFKTWRKFLKFVFLNTNNHINYWISFPSKILYLSFLILKKLLNFIKIIYNSLLASLINMVLFFLPYGKSYYHDFIFYKNRFHFVIHILFGLSFLCILISEYKLIVKTIKSIAHRFYDSHRSIFLEENELKAYWSFDIDSAFSMFFICLCCCICFLILFVELRRYLLSADHLLSVSLFLYFSYEWITSYALSSFTMLYIEHYYLIYMPIKIICFLLGIPCIIAEPTAALWIDLLLGDDHNPEIPLPKYMSK